MDAKDRGYYVATIIEYKAHLAVENYEAKIQSEMVDCQVDHILKVMGCNGDNIDSCTRCIPSKKERLIDFLRAIKRRNHSKST